MLVRAIVMVVSILKMTKYRVLRTKIGDYLLSSFHQCFWKCVNSTTRYSREQQVFCQYGEMMGNCAPVVIYLLSLLIDGNSHVMLNMMHFQVMNQHNYSITSFYHQTAIHHSKEKIVHSRSAPRQLTSNSRQSETNFTKVNP